MLSFIFDSTEVRVFNLESLTWFNAQDVCNILDITNPYRLLSKYVLPKYHRTIQENGKVGRGSLYVAEPGLYALMFQSKNIKALNFQQWVFEELLPKIRSEGYYISQDATTEQLQSLQNEVTRLQAEKNELQKKLQEKILEKIDLELDTEIDGKPTVLAKYYIPDDDLNDRYVIPKDELEYQSELVESQEETIGDGYFDDKLEDRKNDKVIEAHVRKLMRFVEKGGASLLKTRLTEFYNKSNGIFDLKFLEEFSLIYGTACQSKLKTELIKLNKKYEKIFSLA
jgi:prophage antirepressor-like protein